MEQVSFQRSPGHRLCSLSCRAVGEVCFFVTRLEGLRPDDSIPAGFAEISNFRALALLPHAPCFQRALSWHSSARLMRGLPTEVPYAQRLPDVFATESQRCAVRSTALSFAGSSARKPRRKEACLISIVRNTGFTSFTKALVGWRLNSPTLVPALPMLQKHLGKASGSFPLATFRPRRVDEQHTADTKRCSILYGQSATSCCRVHGCLACPQVNWGTAGR